MVTLFQRYILCVALLCVAVCGAAQKATVERMEMLPMDLSGSKYPRFDNNGEPCALVRVEVIADGVDFFGDVIKPVEHKMGEYWVYMLAGSKMLQIKSDAFLPLMVNFADYGIFPLQPKVTYVITLSLPAATAPQQSSVPVAEYSEDLDYNSFQDIHGKFGFKDAEGNIVIPAKYENASDRFTEGLGCVRINGKWGFIDKNDNFVIDAHYDYAYPFAEGLAAVKTNGKWGYIDKNGNFVIDARYDDAHLFRNGQAEVKINGKWGKIDKSGKVVIPVKYDYIGSLSDGLSRTKLNGKWGFVDKDGSFVIAATYDWVHDFSEGLASVEINGKYGFIDKAGKLVIPAKYISAQNFSEGLAAVEVKKEKWGYIDTKGKLVIPARYMLALGFSDGRAWVVLRRQYYIDKNGNEVK